MPTNAEIEEKAAARREKRRKAILQIREPKPERPEVIHPTIRELNAMFDRLIARRIYDFEPYILHAFKRGPDPDAKKPKPAKWADPWSQHG